MISVKYQKQQQHKVNCRVNWNWRLIHLWGNTTMSFEIVIYNDIHFSKRLEPLTLQDGYKNHFLACWSNLSHTSKPRSSTDFVSNFTGSMLCGSQCGFEGGASACDRSHSHITSNRQQKHITLKKERSVLNSIKIETLVEEEGFPEVYLFTSRWLLWNSLCVASTVFLGSLFR